MIIKDHKVVSVLPKTKTRFKAIILLTRNSLQFLFLAVTTTTISSEVAYAISGSRLYAFSPEPNKNKSTLSSENTRHLLSCFAWTLKNMDKGVLQKYEKH